MDMESESSEGHGVDDIATQRFKSPIEMNLGKDLPTEPLHLLPCQIAFSGPAPVSTYFMVDQVCMDACFACP